MQRHKILSGGGSMGTILRACPRGPQGQEPNQIQAKKTCPSSAGGLC